MVCLVAVAFMACDKHDSLDDQAFVGKMAPTVYWSVQSTVVTAGDSVPFEAQYYTASGRSIDRLEVWYNVTEVESKEVSAPYLVSFSYTVTSTIERERRISTAACAFDHYGDILLRPGSIETSGVDSMGKVTHFKETYRFSDKFPTSPTLSTISFSDATWDSAQVKKYMGETFMQDFKDSIEVKLKGCAGYGHGPGYDATLADSHWADYKSIWVNMRGLDSREFYTYTDSALNKTESEQAGYDIYDYFFKGHQLPEAVDSAYLAVEFKDLIYDGNENKINYKKAYKLHAQLKCIDEDGTAGLSLAADIDLN